MMAYLNHREKGGYTTHELNFYPKDDQMASFTALVYIGTELNPNYLGPAPVESIADQVVKSRGPSGCNTEYLLELAEAMRRIAPLIHDEHLFTLESRVRELMRVLGKDCQHEAVPGLPSCKCQNYIEIQVTLHT